MLPPNDAAAAAAAPQNPVSDSVSVLAIETADPRGGAIFVDDAGRAVTETFSAENRHAQEITQVIGRLLPTRPLPRVRAIFVDRGPGSHTGVRIGLACAKILAWQTATPAFGVCSLDALAHAAVAESSQAIAHAPTAGMCVAVLPCRSGMVFAQVFRVSGPVAEAGATIVPVSEPEIVDVRAGLPERWHGCFAIGDALHREPTLRRAIESGEWMTTATLPGWPRPADVAFVGQRESALVAVAQWPATLVPLYLAPALAKTVAERTATAS